jgi:hypothetical protein
MKSDFSKVVRIGTINTGWKRPRFSSIYLNIKYKDGRLSITGVVGPTRTGNAHGSCGQIIMGFKEYDKRGWTTLSALKLAPNWTLGMVRRLFDVWAEWHLNDMQSGTPAQQAYLKRFPVTDYTYTKACEALKAVDLYEDEGHEYGRNWQVVKVPANVLKFLKGLPDTDLTPAWC